MSLVFGIAIVAICFPGVGAAVSGTIGEFAVEGFFIRRKMSEMERLIYLGLPVEPSELESFYSDLTHYEIPGDDLPEALRYIAGEYVFMLPEMTQLMDAIRHIDISQNLGGPFAKEFNEVVKKGPKGKEFRTGFEAHGVDIGKLLVYGRRRLHDPQLRQLLGLENLAA
jgi:hypothetical protein